MKRLSLKYHKFEKMIKKTYGIDFLSFEDYKRIKEGNIEIELNEASKQQILKSQQNVAKMRIALYNMDITYLKGGLDI